MASFFTMGQEYQALQATDLRSTAEGRGFAVEVLDAGDNAVLQIQQLFHFIHAPEGERPLAFVVQTRVPDGLERVARNAAAAGIGWMLLNRTAPYLDSLRQEHPRQAMQEGIGGAGLELKVVPAEWTEASGEKAVAGWLRLKTSERFEPALVGCQNDALALGALVSVKQLAATIVVASCGGPAVGLLDRALGTGEPPPPVLVIPPRSFPPVEELVPRSG